MDPYRPQTRMVPSDVDESIYVIWLVSSVRAPLPISVPQVLVPTWVF